MRRESLELAGTPASPGLARGRLVVLRDAVGEREASRDPDAEAGSLHAALAAARAELERLTEASCDGEAQAILEFQIAMLEDEVVTAPALVAIEAGTPADHAWRAAMEQQIVEYREAQDPYFRARSADLCDMRDRVLRRLAGSAREAIPQGAIVVAADLGPSRFLEISWDGGGIALFAGSPSSHVAMLARARGVPMIVGLSRADLSHHQEALLDADNGTLVVSPDAATTAVFLANHRGATQTRAAEAACLPQSAVTAGGERVRVLLNVADVAELAALDPGHCDGIGLVRTELLFHRPGGLPDEEEQYAVYRRIVEWARGKPVTIRTLDAGGDKPIPGYTLQGESNPFLGVRGVRLSLRHPAVLDTQLRALARAAALGPLKVMVPMVTRPLELDAVRKLLEKSERALRLDGVPVALPPLGMMVEVPAAALSVDLFDADFLSIGSNDLIQYLTACGRDTGELGALQDPLQPAVLRLIRNVTEHGAAHGIEVSLCGDMAAEVPCLDALLDLGLRTVSVAPAALGRVKAAIARYPRQRDGH
jgi:phosphoenolpyruvate-protein phosphotransferase (PTS system enzyme I)